MDAALADPGRRLHLVFQPVVDVRRGVVAGYEALTRFVDPDGARSAATPDRWFAAADAQGRGAALEAVVVHRCLHLRPTLPPNCFLTVNVSPHLLTEPELADPLLAAGDLSPLVLELTEHRAVPDLRPLVALRDRLQDRGALIALDDAGSGYSGLQQVARVRPQLIKLDRALVAGADRDEVKIALAQLLGEFGGRIDAWLLAEGVETWGEMDAFLRLGVPLAQGWLLGRPGPPWVALDPATGERLRRSAARAALAEHVASLVEQVPLVGPDDPAGAHPAARGPAPAADGVVRVRVDGRGRPVALLLPHRRSGDAPGHRLAAVSLRVPASAGVVEVAQRLVAREEDVRFDPVVVVDDLGRAAGVVRVERVLQRLAELAPR
ncbi:EAL domain-containing protein [Vallicoccus soli]|uniref:EAL domain-containing protein n=1 Tax=Vallicoccus soli TaxID=2339232 RepID=A0A3A3ZK81_9ACTN|nr:EAL domain-containing protein [Vallicoccus soli]